MCVCVCVLVCVCTGVCLCTDVCAKETAPTVLPVRSPNGAVVANVRVFFVFAARNSAFMAVAQAPVGLELDKLFALGKQQSLPANTTGKQNTKTGRKTSDEAALCVYVCEN